MSNILFQRWRLARRKAPGRPGITFGSPVVGTVVPIRAQAVAASNLAQGRRVWGGRHVGHWMFVVIASLAGGNSLYAVDAQSLDFFEKQVRPLLVKRCFACHSGTKAGGGLSLETAAAWQQGGESGPAIVPGQPDESLLVKAINYDSLEMPPSDQGGKLPQDEIAVLTKWIAMGAPDPRGEQNTLGGMRRDQAHSWWSFQPLPHVHPDPVPTQIDAFLQARLEQHSLTTTTAADKRTLIRRATYDLTGLPPTPEEVDAFLADDAVDAFDKVIDRLLESNQYGARWGRHWLDIVRYADTAGENTDRPLPHAWRYRNWVLDAVNRDMPYDQFVRMQICGDLVSTDGSQEERAEGIIATGYLAVARRFGHDIDKDIHLMHEDVIDNVGKCLLGLTLGCARCHDHKYDPITASDYYALYGIFNSTRFSFPGCEPKGQPRDLVPLIDGAVADTLTADYQKKLKEYEEQAPVIPVAYAVADAEPRNARLHQRGDPEQLGDEIPRRWLSVFGGEPVAADGSSGRRDLADWIIEHPLSARVMVNRIWQWHFGRGLVATANDFGSRGEPPSHGELLDWLAAHFHATGYRMKPMHRLIMKSAAYQRGSTVQTIHAEKDPDNRWLARFSRRRLTAEEIRDSLLSASGALDLSVGEAHPFPPEADWTFTQHNPFSAVYDTNRRSVFMMVQRQQRHPYLALFDGADPNSSTATRQSTTVPTQALYFLNDPFFHAQAEMLAESICRQVDESARLRFAFRRLFQRTATAVETEIAHRFLATYPGNTHDKWAAYARVLMASNEFLYVD